ncbi:MAG: hypothetical protein AAB336_02035, partial [Acidobacteriota bacterium]
KHYIYLQLIFQLLASNNQNNLFYKYPNFMKRKLLILSFAFIFTAIFVSFSNANPINLSKEQKGIIGTWQFKKNVSASNIKQQSFLPTVFAPQSLVLAADTELNEITINEGFKEFIQTQTLQTNGTRVAKTIYQIGKVSTKAFWKEKKLVVEIEANNGDKITETFELSSNRKQLFVTVQLTQKNSTKNLKVRRVYERVADVNEFNTAKVGITVYPL